MRTIYLDCGNTRLKWRLDNERGSVGYDDLAQWASSQLFTGLTDSTADGSQPVQKVVFAAVRFDQALASAVQSWMSYGLVVVRIESSAHAAGVTCAYTDPSKLGVDRWLAVIAAWHRHRSNLVVLDAGTAITVDGVRSDGQHVGGYIVPGLGLMLRSLALETERVKVALSQSEDDLAPAVDTAAAVNRGVILMAVGLVTQALSLMNESDCSGSAACILVCGGDAPRLLPHIEHAVKRLYPDGTIAVLQAQDLVLDGLEIVS